MLLEEAVDGPMTAAVDNGWFASFAVNVKKEEGLLSRWKELERVLDVLLVVLVGANGLATGSVDVGRTM